MSNQNIYDNDTFFEGYKALRAGETNYNDLLEQPAMAKMLPDLTEKDVLDLGFRKDGVDYSYACIEGLKEFADLGISDIKIRNISETKFMLLSLEQYLKVYQKSSLDGYRMNVKEKYDNQKIEFIKKQIICEK